MGCQPIYIFFVLWLKILMWNFILRYFIINYLIKNYRFPRIFVIVIGILASSMLQNILKSYGWWDLIYDFELIYLLLDTYIYILEELDTKRLFRGFTTPVFVTSCHACFVACHACFVVLPRLFSWLRVTPGYLPSWTVCPRLFSWLRVTPGDLPSWTMCPRLLFRLC